MSKKIEFLSIVFFKTGIGFRNGVFPYTEKEKNFEKGEVIKFFLLSFDDRILFDTCEYRSFNGETVLIRKY